MRFGRFCILTTALLLTGCVSERQIINDATNEARDHCLSEGKQFIHTKTEVAKGSYFGERMVKVAGMCVGPGDPGYLEPPVAKP